MSELPIRRFMQEEFNPIVNQHQLDPFEAYTHLKEQLDKRHTPYDTYAQATLTSGGHARNPNLSWHEKLLRNVNYAQEMAKVLYDNGQLHPRHTVEAATLGLITDWSEKDYITFWFNVLAQPDTTANGQLRTDRLRKLFNKHISHDDIDFSKFNDYSLTNDQRYQHYIAYANAAVDAMMEFDDYEVVSRLVAVSEVGGSLGASTERYFTKRLGGIAYNLALVQLSGSQQPKPGTASASLIKDTDELVRYGAQIYDPRTGEQIVLVKEPEEQESPQSTLRD